MNLIDLIEKFRCENKCRDYLETLRWPNGIECPRCQSDKISCIHDRDQFDCDGCRYQFSVTAMTIMHDTKLPLWKWFLAVYMIVESKKGISANQLKRTLKVSYKTAWYLCHRIRRALETPDGFLNGVVEIDESWIGGKGKRHKNRYRNKSLIVGAVERHSETSKVRIKAHKHGVTPNTKTLGTFVRANLSKHAVVFSDDHSAYPKLLKDHKRHETIAHKNKIWVRGEVHTNSIEGVWSLFKRSVIGSYHQVSCKHLPAYLDEFEFRFNNRDNPYIFRDAMKQLLRSGNVEYKELVA